MRADRLPVTPIQRLGSFDTGWDLYVKRDDLLPFCFGGNKARIAECFMDDMKSKGGTCMVAYGSTRSNLSRALACACSSEGARCVVISPSDDDGSRPRSFNSRIVEMLGAEVVPCGKGFVCETVCEVLGRLEGEGEMPYYIYGDETGVGNEEVPVRAYRAVSDEIALQERSMGVRFDRVYIALGTGMSYAGLLAGDAAARRERRVVGISVARPATAASEHVARYLAASLGPRAPTDRSRSQTGSCMGGYGCADEGQRGTMLSLLAREGVPSDETYVGKAFDGMLRLLAEDSSPGGAALFIHTGGTPLFFDNLEGR